MFLKLQARFKRLPGAAAGGRRNARRVIQYYADEWRRNPELSGYEGEILYADRLD